MPKRIPLAQSGLRWIWIAIIFFIIDQLTKNLIVANFILGERFEILPFFDLTLAYNTGAAFSFLADQGGWQVFFFSTISSIVGVGLLYWLSTLPAKNWWLSIALCFIFAGAMGNLYDRLVLGKVVDFILVYYDNWRFPSFNVADSVIFVGAAMMLYDSFMNPDGDPPSSKGNDK